ncbi:chemotaxis protein CheW [Desulfotomaculum varum]|uniref:CheW domain protein n=1 Tax=Desulforamulus hydrothermalis Lam5 = DSM 18033 TaxID=1121428 RepID=K8DX43_9FIRM|nr:chemotaxis protein CheW [Desulforamulus hydrothermalis]CCO07000.1 CheW domain protein [Desulforamulus hydrothermalis Lam5 = DSM 18033]SHG97921.1 purine-binding chemotaxis protein CheW [Desulforamulus hydrothermalis Lam5 = DSM 18033]
MAVGQEEQLVVFQLNDQQYALPIHETQEIIRMAEVTRLPNTSYYIEGIINLRGTILPVISLNRRLGLPETEQNEDTRIIVVENKGNKVGMIVDSVLEVGRYTENEVEPPNMIGDNVDFLKGVVKKGDQLWLLINLDTVL